MFLWKFLKLDHSKYGGCYIPLEPDFYEDFDFPGSKSLMITQKKYISPQNIHIGWILNFLRIAGSVVRAFWRPVYRFGRPKNLPKRLHESKKSASFIVLKMYFCASDAFQRLLNSQKQFKTSPVLIKSNSSLTSIKKTWRYDRNALPDIPFLVIFDALKANATVL